MNLKVSIEDLVTSIASMVHVHMKLLLNQGVVQNQTYSPGQTFLYNLFNLLELLLKGHHLIWELLKHHRTDK